MEKKTVLLAWTLVLSMVTKTEVVLCSQYYSESLPYERVQERKTHLRFFVHDTLSGENPSAVLIAHPNSTAPFGSTYAMDDPLTEGPEPMSKVIGNARGIYVLSSRDPKTSTIVMYADLAFTTGKFSGSSISVFSRNPVTEKHRELAVVGGRGQFRYARGFILEKSVYFNGTNGNDILEYNVEIIHP